MTPYDVAVDSIKIGSLADGKVTKTLHRTVPEGYGGVWWVSRVVGGV